MPHQPPSLALMIAPVLPSLGSARRHVLRFSSLAGTNSLARFLHQVLALCQHTDEAFPDRRLAVSPGSGRAAGAEVGWGEGAS